LAQIEETELTPEEEAALLAQEETAPVAQAEEEVVAVAPVEAAPVTAEEEIVEAVPAPAPKGRKKQPAAPKTAPVTPPAPKAPETKPSEKAPKGLQIDSDEIARRIAEQNNRLVEGKILDNQGNPIYDLSGGIAVNGITTLTDKKYGHGSTKASEAESFNILADILNTGNFSGWFGENKGNRIFTSGKFFIASNNIDGGGKGKIDPSEVEVILNVGLTPFAQDLANRFPQTTIKDYNGNIYKPQATTTTKAEFTSKQEVKASEAKPAEEGKESGIAKAKKKAEGSKNAKDHSSDLSGEAYELEGGIGLVQGFNLIGKPVYSAYKNSQRTRVDIDSFKGTTFTTEELNALKDLKKQLEEFEKSAQTQDPFKQQGRVAKTDSVPENVRKFVEAITKSLGIDKKIIIITDGDFNEGQYQKHGLYGTLAQVRSAKLSNANPYEYGAKRYMADADAFYIYYDGKLKGDQLFTVVSHEIGHIVEQEVFSKSSEQTKKAVKEDYEKWFASLTGKTVEEVAKETRDITLADLIEGNTRKFDSSKDRYISSFSEYFADNVSKWARTSEKPKSAVDKYFAGIVELFKKLHDYVSEKGLYSKSLFEWLDGMYETETAPQTDFTSSQSSEAATAFDKAKTSKNFDKKYGKGTYKVLSDITKNFEDIMDGLSGKIKQDCL
jgi:hypothetical protein